MMSRVTAAGRSSRTFFSPSTPLARLTELGAEVLEQAIRSAELSEAVDNIVSNRLSKVCGTLRLSAPPTISDTLLTPIATAFQAAYPDVRFQIFVTDRHIDHISGSLLRRIGATPLVSTRWHRVGSLPAMSFGMRNGSGAAAAAIIPPLDMTNHLALIKNERDPASRARV
jgi:DNA-binding transcriptional LysR family regulator